MFEGFTPDDPRFAWLSDHASGWQFGEQGILVALADAINPWGQCVEIGAGDGDQLPLTIDPFYHRGNECVLFEADLIKLGRLVVKYPNADNRGAFLKGMCYNIKSTPIVAVIDIDGFDREAMKTLLSHCEPMVLMVEHFDTFYNATPELFVSRPVSLMADSQEIPEWLLGKSLAGGFRIQDIAATIYSIARHFGYVRVGTTRVNSIFVHNSHLSKVSR
jgi:hypothetical protein